MNEVFRSIGLICAVVMPFWNIPLIVKMFKRKSSADISLAWVTGVWVCVVLMFPSGVQSPDVVWRAFNIVNTIMFTAVFITVLKFRNGKSV